MIEMQNQDAESLTGIKAFYTGISGQSLGNTATGVRSAMDATAKRELGILRRLSRGIIEIGRKIAAMNAVNLSDEEVIMITDEEQVAISRDSLKGVFDIRLKVSTPEVDNEQAQELAFMLQTIGNCMDINMQKIILSKIAELKKIPDLAKAIKDFEPQPDPMQQQIAQLQMQLLQAQIANEQAKAFENQTDGELNRAKVESELAKSETIKSQKDMIDLDFVRKMDGADKKDEIEKDAAKKSMDHAVKMEQNAQQFDHELGKKAVDSLLSTDTPNTIKGEDIVPSGNPENPVVGMDMPSENISDYIGR
jgi:hypothetical protein